MDIEGGGRLVVFGPEDELPHTPGSHENWQESFVIIWYDLKQHVGGFFRLGHEPNYNGGRAQFMANIFSPEGVYHRSTDNPLRPQDRLKNGFLNGEDTLKYEYIDGRIHWWLKDANVEMNLVVDAYVPAIDAHRREGAPNAESYTGAHVDAACAVSGTLSVNKRTWTINNALAVRDHGWGMRDWNSLLSHRWTLGTFDRHNSFVAMSFLTTANQLARFGWVIRNNKVIFAEKVEIRALIAHDGATNLGGTTRMTLTTGEVLEAEFEPVYPCIASWVHQTICFDSMSRVRWGDSVGFGVFETTCNIQGGTVRPPVYDGAIAADGWYSDIRPLLA
jgi:hypothetical protein